MVPIHLGVTEEALRQVCQRWSIRGLAVFGAAARYELRPDSDVDVMVEFQDEVSWSLFDFAQIQIELADHFGRPVDLVEKGTVRNPYRRRSIERDITILYAA